MSKLWFVSDQHFGHANIIKYAKRPFKSVDEMNSVMVARHNERVSDSDKVYFLGDVAFNEKVFTTIIPALKGKKRLILGNHDRLSVQVYLRYFDKILGAFNYKDGDHSFHFTHYPAQPESFNPDGRFVNVHGHIHEKLVPDKRFINICVEHTDYSPVDLEWLEKRIA